MVLNLGVFDSPAVPLYLCLNGKSKLNTVIMARGQPPRLAVLGMSLPTAQGNHKEKLVMPLFPLLGPGPVAIACCTRFLLLCC